MAYNDLSQTQMGHEWLTKFAVEFTYLDRIFLNISERIPDGERL